MVHNLFDNRRGKEKALGIKTVANSDPVWIKSPIYEGMRSLAFEKGFLWDGSADKAEAFLACVGIYAFFLNGRRVGPGVLEPGISEKKRVLAQRYDVLPYLKKGNNAIRVEIAEGWAVGVYGTSEHKNYVSDHTSFFFALSLPGVSCCSDASWKAYAGNSMASGIYYGEDIDLTKEDEFLGFALVDDSAHPSIEEGGVPIIEHEPLPGKSLFLTPKGERVVDFGQNLTGYPEILLPECPRGTEFAFDFGEVLDKEGNFYRANYRSARSQFRVISDGKRRWIKPAFSFFGYRYMRIIATYGLPDLRSYESIPVYSDISQTIGFSSSEPSLQKLFENVLWSQKDNFLDIPTDCPQRDERLGWTGDAQIFSSTAVMNFDCEKFYLRWLKDVCLDQNDDGGVPGVVPNVLNGGTMTSCGWGDVITILPESLHYAYGSLDGYRLCLPAMKKWVRFIRHDGPEEYLWLNHPHYGDWLALDGGEGPFGLTQMDFLSSIYFLHSASILEKAMKLLGDDDPEFSGLSARIKKEIRAKFMKDGLPCLYYHDEEARKGRREAALTQTSLSGALEFGIYEGEEERRKLAGALHELLVRDGMKMKTGFLGTGFILYALSRNGYADDAYSLLLNSNDPGWLYSVLRGATTVWESYDSILPDGSFKSETMNSFNHYAHGAVMGWIYKEALGIQAEEAGYKKILFAPKASKRIGSMEARLLSPEGTIVSGFANKTGGTEYTFVSPISEARAIIGGLVYPLKKGSNTLFIKDGGQRHG